MLSYNQQYDIANGIFITYDSQLDYRLMHSKHKGGTRENMKMMFPYQKWETRTKEVFVLACLYTIFTKTPSSFRSFVGELREIDLKDVSSFKHIILNYHDFISKDVSYLRETYGSSIDQHTILNEFMEGKIKFYTAWWYVKFNEEDFKIGRVYAHVIRKLRFLMLFLTFREDSIENIRELFKQIEI